MKGLALSIAGFAYYLWERLEAAVLAERMRRTQERFVTCGKSISIHSDVVIHGPEHVSAGNDISIGEGSRIMAYGGLTIGDNVIISRDVTIYCSDHPFGGDNPLPFGEGRNPSPVIIGDNCWIGAHVRILPGSSIGEGAIIGMGAVVSGKVPPCAIIGQPKFRLLGERIREEYNTAKLRKNGET
jgi:acetyltransferase-like isoleucine patch superfamily enzyme